jgi:hypothetical protein
MRRLSPIALTRLLPAALCLLSLPALAQSPLQTSVRQIRVLDSKNAVEIEVEASDRIVPETQVLTGPDRLVVDFPNAVPGVGLRSQSVLQGEVKDVRVGLFQAKPPITRVVLDLKSPQSYQVFPGRTVIIKIAGGASETASASDPAIPQTRPGLVAANYTRSTERISGPNQPSPQTPLPAANKPLDVWFHDGLLKIRSNKATLSEVLFAVQQRTGAEIGIPAGAEQEQVVVDLGPASAPEVLSQLLNGSKFNFLIVSAPDNPRQLDRVILSQRNENLVVSRAPIPNNNVANNHPDEDDDDAAHATPPPPPAPRPSQPNPMQPEAHPEVNNPSGDNQPQ